MSLAHLSNSFAWKKNLHVQERSTSSRVSHLSIVAGANCKFWFGKSKLFFLIILRIGKEKDPFPAQIFLFLGVQETLNPPRDALIFFVSITSHHKPNCNQSWDRLHTQNSNPCKHSQFCLEKLLLIAVKPKPGRVQLHNKSLQQSRNKNKA